MLQSSELVVAILSFPATFYSLLTDGILLTLISLQITVSIRTMQASLAQVTSLSNFELVKILALKKGQCWFELRDLIEQNDIAGSDIAAHVIHGITMQQFFKKGLNRDLTFFICNKFCDLIHEYALSKAKTN